MATRLDYRTAASHWRITRCKTFSLDLVAVCLAACHIGVAAVPSPHETGEKREPHSRAVRPSTRLQVAHQPLERLSIGVVVCVPFTKVRNEVLADLTRGVLACVGNHGGTRRGEPIVMRYCVVFNSVGSIQRPRAFESCLATLSKILALQFLPFSPLEIVS